MPFSLIEDRWIPAIAADGAREWITPRQITESDEQDRPRWVDVDWGRPDLRIATYELLIGLFATALAPQDSATLPSLLRTPPSPDVLSQALQQLAPYFELDGEGPRFLQALEDLRLESGPVDALFMDAPGDITVKKGADFFVKRGRTPTLSRKAAVIALYALQAFAPSGGSGHRTSMRGGGPLTTLIVPPQPNLWRRVAANLPLLANPDRQPPEDLSFVFPWARATRMSHNQATTAIGPAHHTHWLQHYFGMPRPIRLDFRVNDERMPCPLTGDVDDVIVTGFRMAQYGTNYDGWRHPLTPYYEPKPNELLPVHPQSGHVGYREWFGYLFDGGGKGAVSHPADVVTTYLDVFGGSPGATRLLAAGYVTDNMKTENYVEAEIPLLTLPHRKARALLGEAVRDHLLVPAEMVATELRRKLSDALDSDFKKTIIANVVEQFWIETEQPFVSAFEAASQAYGGFAEDAEQDEILSVDLQPHIERWLADLRAIALRLFRQNAPLDQLGDLSSTQRAKIIAANRQLHLSLHGFGKGGEALFKQMNLPPPEQKSPRKPSKAGVSQ